MRGAQQLGRAQRGRATRQRRQKQRLSLGSYDHLRLIRVLTWANGRGADSSGLAAFTVNSPLSPARSGALVVRVRGTSVALLLCLIRSVSISGNVPPGRSHENRLPAAVRFPRHSRDSDQLIRVG